MKIQHRLMAGIVMLMGFASVWAQDDEHAGHTPAAMNTVNSEVMPETNHDEMPGMDHGAMTDEAMIRDPHAYADGYDFSQFPMRHEAGEIKTGSLRVERLEVVDIDNDTSTAYELQAWYGGSFDRAVFKAEGDVKDGSLEDGLSELLWSHAIAPFWDAQFGLRYDSGIDSERSWLAFGVQGLAPYWFETNMTVYVDGEGRSALRLDAEYELLFTQKLIFQPRIEADLYGKNDAERALGSGLSDLAAGIRLRYEIRREFAPYIGLEWVGKYGGTADYARAAGLERAETRAVAGLRFWF